MGLLNTIKKLKKNCFQANMTHEMNPDFRHVLFEMCVTKEGNEKMFKKSGNHAESFSFAKLPENVEELQMLPEAVLNSPFKTAALTLAALCRYEENAEECIEMLNFLSLM